MPNKSIKDQLKTFFNLTPYLEDQAVARQSIIEGVSFRGPNILILIFAIFVASLGLNTNSPAVIIGAMLISPLMGPIIGIGLGVGTYDFQLIKRAARNLAAAALFSVLTATVYFMISPVREGHSELLARTSPTIYDVLIAIFGGAAGIVAIACKQKGNVIPGVAIATALMPPLCTAGYGLATWQLSYFFGAFYLFLINSIFIALSTLVGVKLFKFAQVKFLDPARRKRIKSVVMTVVICTVLPSVYLTTQMMVESYYVSDVDTMLDQNLKLPKGTYVLSKDVSFHRWKKSVSITLIGNSVDTDSLQRSLSALMGQSRLMRGTALTIEGASREEEEQRMSEQDARLLELTAQNQRCRAEIDSLGRVIADRQQQDMIAWEIQPDIVTFLPQIKGLSVQRQLVCNVETRAIDTVCVALVDGKLTEADREKLASLLQRKYNMKDVRVISADIMPVTASSH